MTSRPLMSRATPFWGYSAYSEFPSIEMADKREAIGRHPQSALPRLWLDKIQIVRIKVKTVLDLRAGRFAAVGTPGFPANNTTPDAVSTQSSPYFSRRRSVQGS
ncbi:hypothetical protein Bbelb_382250 [Branchiostoma belcheri]|nr:hypothetical protein Bbelb_382250 [Branchiostoma belcheri]